MPDVRLRKEERLKSRKQLGALFAEGRSTFVYPVRFIWMTTTSRDGVYPVRVAFGVSRKRWKRAVDRNLFKRRMRESYRLHKQILYQLPILPDQQILISCLYTADVECAFEQIHAAIGKGLKRLADQVPQLT